MKVLSWRVPLLQLGAESKATLSPRFCLRIQAVKARSKRRPKKWQDKSNLRPLNGENEITGSNFSRSAETVEDSPFFSSREDTESEAPEVSMEDAADGLPISRKIILKACVTTSAAVFVVAVIIRQVAHLAAESGWSVPDSTLLLDYNVEFWYLEVVLGLVVVISISRQLLLRTWPEFLESSNTANKEVLGPLPLHDYVVVATLPAISEELLFRGALLPLCGLDWKGVTITGVLFGVLHLTGGRKNAFAIWASMVGMLYGLACVATHSVTVPMVAHSANNMIGALIWRWKQQECSQHGD